MEKKMYAYCINCCSPVEKYRKRPSNYIIRKLLLELKREFRANDHDCLRGAMFLLFYARHSTWPNT